MRSTQFLDNLNDAVRDNPLAAGLIGIGLAWIVLGKSGPIVRESGMARTAKRTIDTTVDATAGTVSGAVNQGRKAAAAMSDALSQGVETAGAKIGGVMEGLKTPNREAKTQSEFERHYPRPPSGRLTDLLERQPLALAAVGLAVGAAIASALPSTDIEGSVMGTAGEKLQETMADATDTIAERVGAAIDEATDEAVAQNLTPAAVKDALKAGSEKVKTVAEAGLDSLKN